MESQSDTDQDTSVTDTDLNNVTSVGITHTDSKTGQASFTRQLVACMAIYVGTMSIGAVAGFSGVAIPQLAEDPHNGGFGFSEEEISWFASLQIFSTFSTCVVGGFLGEYLGRRMVYCLANPIFLTGFLCIALAPDVQLLFFGRILGGVAIGLVTAAGGVYVSEISTKEWKTTFNAWLSSCYMVGMVIVFTLGKWLPWRWLSGVSCMFSILSLFLLSLIPESPSWLVTQGRLTEAKKALRWLRGPDCDITEEFIKLEASYRRTQGIGAMVHTGFWQRMKRTVGEVISKLQRPDVFKPLILVTVLMLLQQCTGTATLTYYAVILMGDGNILDKYSATIIYGFIRLVSTLCGGLLLRRFARRPLLILSSLSVALGMSLLGASCYISQDKGDKEISVLLDLLPLISVNLVAVSYQLGLGPIGWAYMAELYPVDMRAVLSGFSSMNVNFFIFLVVKTYPTLTASSLHPWGTYWLYAGVAICAALFGITLLPETKGKTLAEVSQYFYVWCTFKSKSMDNIEYQSLGNTKATDVTLSNSFVYRNTEKAMETIKDNKEKEIEKIQLRYQRRSAELKDVEGSLKRRTLELSQLEEMINQKTEELKEQEERLKRKSAPIVMLEDLDDLLLQV